MQLSPLGVRATAGTLLAPSGIVLRHQWTDDGLTVSQVSNGAHVLHLAVAVCVLNDTYREAERLGIVVEGVAVDADGGFDDDWRSTGVEYSVTVDSSASPDSLALLASVVDDAAEIPRALRAGVPVARAT
ncbi:OsmC family protein [Phycicoccus sp. BSK3Z-2]|uniref:OsmC family protein n=1 Tax=Phycicoccus avicenniae TaxID=2828860 RepID=A0A941HYW8_9MICO|nr:OsmC family protein [Phycicoccus avicenniae]MBR7743423.1 OsmC family protein [Phycicoccus avicenniae]